MIRKEVGDMCLAAIVLSIIAWIAGLFIDANLLTDELGFLELRILMPMLVMGGFILHELGKNKKD